MKKRCSWCTDPLLTKYHDEEWGVPVHYDRHLFEFLVLDGAQAGLCWSTILKRREAYRSAFDGFDPRVVAHYGGAKVRSLLNDRRIIRNRLKIEAAIANASGVVAIQEEFGSFSEFIWQFVGGQTIHNHWPSYHCAPAVTIESRRMSEALKSRGFKFVGPTICYAFMQTVGMVNDHSIDCFRHRELMLSSTSHSI